MRTERYSIMSVPGKREDGRDTWWLVLDQRTRESSEIGRGESGMLKAFRECRRLNGAVSKGESHDAVRGMPTSDLVRLVVEHAINQHENAVHTTLAPPVAGTAWTRERALAASAELDRRIPRRR